MTETRPIQPTPVGALRFNTDSAKLEYFDGNQYVNITTDSPEQNTGGTRGIFYGGGSPFSIDMIQVDTTGSMEDFGDPTTNQGYIAAFSSRIRAVGAGGAPSNTDVIQFVTIAQKGNGTDFGDLTSGRHAATGASNGTRGLICGGEFGSSPTYRNTIEYVTIAQTGNAVDFGDMTESKRDQGSCASPTRAIIAGGYSTDPVSGSQINTIMYVTTSTQGNAANFGDLTVARMGIGGASNAVRGIFSGGHPSNATMDSVEIATLGDATDFGDLFQATFRGGAASSPTRYVYYGGNVSPYRDVQYVQFSTRGNAQDFGDYTPSNQRYDIQGGGCSNGHGGLG